MKKELCVWVSAVKEISTGKFYSFSSGNGYLSYERLEKQWNELTLIQKIGKKFFGGRYFFASVQDIKEHYERVHGVVFERDAQTESEALERWRNAK